MKKLLNIIAILLILTGNLKSQTFTNAIHKDDSRIIGWAKNCKVKRGFIDISDTSKTFTQAGITSNKAFFGNDSMACGKANDINNIVSLGDGGSAVLTFEKPIKNGEGYDFVVFENGIKSQIPPYLYFLELAFVEVSSDGKNFIRFPAISHTQFDQQIGSFGQLNPNDLINLAGNFPLDYGTPFDLQELSGIENLDINKINFIRIIDIPGNISEQFSIFDSESNKINDPFPTPFNTCGFDLNAVGVLYFNQTNSSNNLSNINIFPNPASKNQNITITIGSETKSDIYIYDRFGKLVIKTEYSNDKKEIITSGLNKGIYFIKIENKIERTTIKMLIL